MSNFTKKSQLGGLMLTRREGESISVNHGEIFIEVVEVRGHYVRLAFKANKEISIQRTETLTSDSLPQVSDHSKNPA